MYAPSLLEFAETLTRLDVSRNHLGFLPTHVSECVRLRYLDVSHNELLFLPDVARLASLADLRASGNRLQKLPDSLSACVSLRSLYAGQNPELDALPNLEPCVSLETLVVDRCALKVLPVSVAAAPRLTRLYVEGNPLTFPGPEVYERGERRGAPVHPDARTAGVAGDARGGTGVQGGDEGEERKREEKSWALCFGAARRVVVRDDCAPASPRPRTRVRRRNALLRRAR